jgi:hypothetical protein
VHQYRDYLIDSNPLACGDTKWNARVAIVDQQGRPVRAQWPAEFLERRYPSKEEAYKAGIAAAERWIDAMPVV